MSGFRQGWLVALREMRERSRSRAFQASVAIMLVVVVAIIVVPSFFDDVGGTKDVGLAGTVPDGLEETMRAQADALDRTIHVRHFDTVTAADDAVRDGKVDVAVIDGHRLDWRRHTDEQLRAVVTGAIQLVAIRERAAAAGVDPDAALSLLAPVEVRNVELGTAPGRTADDENAAMVMTVILFITISTYGSLVLTGVVEEKSNRVVEVLLARMPARTLLAGKVAGIGLLGLLQVGATALVALVALLSVDSVDVPAARGSVLAWVVVWFVLGYALYAMAYGTLGSLASRPEDAQSAAGPVMVVMIAGYIASFAAAGDPESGLALVASLFPATAPLTMPGRIAVGAAAWWQPAVAVALTLGAIVGLARLGGRVYSGAILHTGPTLKLREAWRVTNGGRPQPPA